MRCAKNWSWILALACVLMLAAGCSSSDSSGSTDLTVGNTGEDSISANGTNSYTFTATSTSLYTIGWDTVSTGDTTTLELVFTDSTFTCANISTTNTVCSITDILDAGVSYAFSINEVSGVDTTFRIGVNIGN